MGVTRQPNVIKDEFDAFLECGIPGARLPEAALQRVRPRQAAGLQLQAPRFLPVVRRCAHVADRGAPGKVNDLPNRHNATARSPIRAHQQSTDRSRGRFGPAGLAPVHWTMLFVAVLLSGSVAMVARPADRR
jgi:hypothetical protein